MYKDGPNEDTTLLFVVGAHKSGTSWLYHYFRQHPCIFVPWEKELSYFIAERDPPSRLRQIKAMSKKYDALVAPLLKGEEGYWLEDGIAMEMAHDYAALNAAYSGFGDYLNIFKRLRNAQVVADVSPRYDIQGDDEFIAMRDAHVKTKFIFVMREPVLRVWSSILFEFQRKNQVISSDSDEQLRQVKAHAEGNFCKARTDYLSTIERMERLIPSRDRKFMFYESLFQDETMRELCSFLGVPFQAGDYDRRRNPTRSENAGVLMHENSANYLVERYGYVYEDIKKKFGDLVPDSWHF